jgi:hypothetical protein
MALRALWAPPALARDRGFFFNYSLKLGPMAKGFCPKREKTSSLTQNHFRARAPIG